MDALPGKVMPGSNTISSVTLNGGDCATEYNFGECRPPGGVSSIPTLSEWALIALSMLLGLMAWRRMDASRG